MSASRIFRLVSATGIVIALLFFAQNLYRQGLSAGLFLQSAMIVVAFIILAHIAKAIFGAGGGDSNQSEV